LKNSVAAWFVVFALVLVAALAIGTAFRFDAPVRAAIVKSQGKQWKKSDEQKFHAAVRVYGDWPWLMIYGGIALAAAWKLRNREWQRILVAAVLASTLAGIVANASRLSTGRTRPNAGSKIEQGFYGPWNDGRTTIGDRVYNSFPSGHTATAFGLAWVVAFARPWLGVGTLILAGLVGWSSIVMGAHHPSDVVVSVFLSLGVAWFTWRWVDKNGDRVAREAWLWWKRKRNPKVEPARPVD
jgi:membrane-associated phospholipid phosphatase